LSKLTWEDAVRWYRTQPNNDAEIRNNYFDLPVRAAADRYAQSEEFAKVIQLLGEGNGRRILDLGAGNGIASYALARHGWKVTALEPEESDEVGAGAIEQLARETGLTIEVVRYFGEEMPFANKSFAAIHARQVLHHANHLENMVRELYRVLDNNGWLLSTREHVVDNDEQLTAFLKEHPLHALYGGENAYALDRYLSAFTSAGFQVVGTWGPLESVLNFYPGTEAERKVAIRQVAMHSWLRLGRLFAWSETFQARQVAAHTRRDQTPGRIYSFLNKKP
jgi:ubiquinone/menaquinone biosynthesis C-methylase UbiE